MAKAKIDWQRIQDGIFSFPPLPDAGVTPLNLRFHLYSIWLFTLSDLKTIVIPSTVFGAANALAIAVNGSTSIPYPASAIYFIRATLRSALWAWLNLLPFAIDNQRHPDAVAEDTINKPWRAIPSRRLSPDQAKWLMWALYPHAAIVSLYLGGLYQCIALIFLGMWYNDLRGADSSSVTRNFINACGFVAFISGALEVHLGTTPWYTLRMMQWLLIIGAVVFTTVQTQDFYDQEGDQLRGRKTLPLEIGDGPARRITTVMMVLWSCLCPWFWSLQLRYFTPSLLLGGAVARRVLAKRSVSADRTTFKLWNLWVAVLYVLPLIHGATAQQQ